MQDALQTEANDKVLAATDAPGRSATCRLRCWHQFHFDLSCRNLLQAINDAKMRAFKQRVDYETFKKMVCRAQPCDQQHGAHTKWAQLQLS